jgi:hypothetical protein
MQNSKESWFIEVKAVVDTPGHGMDTYTQEQLTYLKNGLKRMPDSSWLLPRLHELRPFESILLFDDGNVVTARPHDLIVNEWNIFQGWKCNVALETLFINYDGLITGGCQEPVFADKDFNIFTEDFSQKFNLDIEFTAIKCPRTHCSCQPETHVTKSL